MIYKIVEMKMFLSSCKIIEVTYCVFVHKTYLC